VWKEGKRMRYSDRTIKSYEFCITKFLDYCEKDISKIGKVDAREFLTYLSDKRQVAGSTLHVYHMAIRFLMEDVLNKNMKLNIRYNRRPIKLPEFLSKEEVRILLNNIKNPKHRFMIAFMYSAGFRVSELLNLKVRDLEIDKGFGFIRNGKGMKDRIFIISDKLKGTLKNIINNEELDREDLLFKSNRDKKYSVRSIQTIIKKACKLAGIKKRISSHTLRHSFATHLIENGYALGEVQSLLGHKSPETTMIYTHMASENMLNIKSPIDSL
jgi:integrase/recombinase XerD